MPYNRHTPQAVNPQMPSNRLFRLYFRHLKRFLLLAALALPAPAWAWGSEGHEIAALIAERHLSAAARAQVAHLLGAPIIMVHESNWADEIRDQRPETGSWHYVDIPLQASRYDSGRDCPARDCVVAQIENDLRILANRRLGDHVRAEALRFLVHFVADVHQPLHAEDNDDKGGNAVRVTLGRDRTNLHSIWDGDVVAAWGPDSAAAADGMERAYAPQARRAWARGTPAGWAEEAHAIARTRIYPPLEGRISVRLPPDYARRQAPLAGLQLARAGVRLAWLLNNTLK